MKKFPSFLISIGLIGILLTSCQSMQNTKISSSGLPDTSLKVVTINLQDVQFLVNIAQDQGFFQKNGIKPEFLNIEKGTDKLLVGGEVDIKIGSMSNALNLYMNQGQPIVLATLVRIPTTTIYSRFPLDKLSEVKKVAIDHFGNDGQYTTIAFLKNHGIDTKNLDMIAIPDDNTKIEMLKSGKIDLAFMTAFKNEKSYSGVLTSFPLYDANSLPGYNFSKAILTNKNALKNKSTALNSFVKSIYETLEYIKNNKEYCVKFIENEFQLNPEEAIMFYDNYVRSLVNEDFVLDPNTLKGVQAIVIDEMKLKGINTDISGFTYPEFAKNTIRK